jgi:DNA-binding transcriptional regulator GbsR (MarR family)
MGHDDAQEIRRRLIEAGGRISQDLGLGRIVGQVLVCLYLSREACSLDTIGEDLELSKASVSIAARQLERLGMIVRVWKKGDRRSYYRTADNFTQALQQGFVEFVRQKMQTVGAEIDYAHTLLHDDDNHHTQDPDLVFLGKRVDRAMVLKEKVERVLGNPLVSLLTRKKK